MKRSSRPGPPPAVLLVLSLLVITGVPPQAWAGPGQEPAAASPAPLKRSAHPAKSKRQPRVDERWRSKRGLFFQRNWGIEIVGVRRVSSGMMLRFDYRVVNPAVAARLSEKKAKPYLIDEATHTALAVPAMENIGELRQTGKLDVGRTYFIIFGNPGGLVKRGGRVTLAVGNDRAEGLVVN